jgi:hypothetical protein
MFRPNYPSWLFSFYIAASGTDNDFYKIAGLSFFHAAISVFFWKVSYNLVGQSGIDESTFYAITRH